MAIPLTLANTLPRLLTCRIRFWKEKQSRNPCFSWVDYPESNIFNVLWNRWGKLPRWKIKVYTHKWTSMRFVDRIIRRTSSEAVSAQITMFMNMKSVFAWRESSYLPRNYCWSIFFILLKIENYQNEKNWKKS